MRAKTVAFFLTLASPVLASDLRLQPVIDCTPGRDCFVQQYMDHDSGPGARDHRCGNLTYNGHDGTDFALPDRAAMNRGVTVRAGAGGVVVGARDGMEDRIYSPAFNDAVQGRECGNGVVIEHFDGWETQYCHLRKGSVTVRTGDRVVVGDKLGEVGLSGQTEFPHLHLSVRRNGIAVNPFAPKTPQSCDPNLADRPLWIDPPDYAPGGVISIGFTDSLPDFDQIKAGNLSRPMMPTDAVAIVLFGFGYGGLKGDRIHLFLSGPAGTVIDHTDILPRDRAQFFRAAGTRLRGTSWAPGTYRARVAIERDGHLLDLREDTLEIR